MKNGSNIDNDLQPMMILTIDIGNGQVDKLQLFDLNNIDKQTYDFCVKNKLDFNTMQEINTQIQNVLKEKQFEEEQELDNVFQEIKEEEEEKITENNLNENELRDKEHESIIMTNNSLEQDTQQKEYKENNIEENNINNEINNNDFNNNDYNINNANMGYINNDNESENNIMRKETPSIRSNSTMSYNGGKNNKINERKKDKSNKSKNSKKKNIKADIKEAFALAKERTAQNQKLLNQQNNEINNNNINNNKESQIIEMNNNDNLDDIVNINNKEQKIENDNNNVDNEHANDNINIENGKQMDDNINNNINENNINNINNENIDSEKTENNSNNTEKYTNIIMKENSINHNSNLKVINNNNNNQNKISKSNHSTKKKLKNISHNGSQITNFNIGRDLYERGMKYRENEKEKLKVLKHNLEVDEEEDNTFIPKINKISDTQKEKIKEKKLECNNPDIINNYKKYKQEKLEELKRKKDEEFNKIYTFKPMINRAHSSNKTIKDKCVKKVNNNEINNNNENRFDKLYNYRIDYKENKDKLKQKIYNEYSFKPQINENSSYYKFKKPFNERLQTYSNKTKENLVKIQKVYEREQGYNEPFKPQVNNNKNKVLLKYREDLFNNLNNNDDKNNTNNNIDHYTKLYLYGKKYEQEKNFLAEKYYQEQNRPPQISESTQEIINKKKEKCFKQIFRVLDNDEDNQISSNHMNINKLPKNIYKILEPIFNELKEENETLNEVEFIFVCEQLYLSLSWNEKRELTNFQDIIKRNEKKEKILKEKNNFSFEPKINKNIRRNFSYDKSNMYNKDKDKDKDNFNDINKINDIINQKNGNGINYINYANYSYNNRNSINNSHMNNTNNSSCYVKKKINNINGTEKESNKNKVNNRINYFNVKYSNYNSNSEISKNNFMNGSNNSSKYSILKNINFNIKGNSNDKNENNNNEIKKINYDDFINVKNTSS